MQRCADCIRKTPERPCVNCDSFIAPGPLRRVAPSPISVAMKSEDGKHYSGRILVLNTMELGMETDAPVPGRYNIEVQPGLLLEVAAVPAKGKGVTHVFDVLAVCRDGETASRLSNEEYQLLAGSAGDLVNEVSRLLPSHLRELVRERLMAEVEKSELLDAMRVGRVMRYEKGHFRHLAGQDDLALPMEEAEKLMRQATRQGTHCREVLISGDGQKIYDMHGIPFDFQTGGLLAFDITDIVEKERQMRSQEAEAYREAIAAVTGGKLQLLTEGQVQDLLFQGEEVAYGDVTVGTDIAAARRRLGELLGQTSGASRHGMLISFTEALTNALKHAGGGRWTIRQSEGEVALVVQDHGQGINIKDLPKATLMKNYSTKKSLGCGFTLMLHYTDCLYLATCSEGTTLVLSFQKSHSVRDQSQKAC